MSDLNNLKELANTVDFWGSATGWQPEELHETIHFALKQAERLEAVEAELERRDAAAGEPAFYISASDIDNLKRAHVVEAAISKVKRFDEIPVYTTPPAPSAPDGWKLVPVEPTIAMTEAAIDEFNESRNMRDTYYALLEHAPAPVAIT